MTETNGWPALAVADWQDTRDTVHLWTQIVGKVKLAATPTVNHWWNSVFYVDARGLTTSLMRWQGTAFDVSFDLVEHELHIRLTDGRSRSMALHPRSVADFYAEFRRHLDDVGLDVPISPTPVELQHATPFAEDTEHASYDAAAVTDFFRSLVCADRVMTDYRADFTGKSSPVHFFWGAFDLAVTRFSGRQAPPHPGGVPNCPDWVMTEAYNAEVASAGYWPGGAEEGVFYAYAYPQPDGYDTADLGIEGASFDTGLAEFVLPYRTVRTADDPDGLLRRFLDATATVAADLAAWPEQPVRPPKHLSAGPRQ